MFAKQLQQLILSFCEQGDNEGFERNGEDYLPGIMLYRIRFFAADGS